MTGPQSGAIMGGCTNRQKLGSLIVSEDTNILKQILKELKELNSNIDFLIRVTAKE